MASPLIYIPGRAPRPRGPREHPGRRIGSVAGAWIADLAALRKCITLCSGCASRFDPKKHHYTREGLWAGRVQGKCDGCRGEMHNGMAFVHDSQVGRTSGCTYDPR